MNLDAPLSLLRSTPLTRGAVHQVALPASARALSTLPRIDYSDAFVVQLGATGRRTAEEWARAMLEDPPAVVRRGLLSGWFTLGVEVDPDLEGRVLGWEVLHSTPDAALLGAGARFGLRGQLVFERRRRTLLFATLLHHENAAARAVWAGVGPGHRQVVRYLLEQMSARERRG